jgi:hypothetical protein
MFEHQIREIKKLKVRRTDGSISLDEILENIVQHIESETNVNS